MEHGSVEKKDGEISNNNDEELAQCQIRWDNGTTKMQQNNSNANVPDAVGEDEDEEKDVEEGGRYYTLPVSIRDEKHSGNPMRVSYSDGSLSTLTKRQMKNEDEEVAIINRRVSFHHDGGSAVTSTSNQSATDSDLPIFPFEQQQQSQSRPSLVTTFAELSAAESRPRSALDNHERMSMNVRGESRGGLSKTLSKRKSFAERYQIEIEQQNHKSSWFKWWLVVFFFSGIGALACLCQLFLSYPYGLMMTSTQIAEIGIAPGCEDSLERCICPRATICATDTLSIILLALARCSAFFDYPL
eukprot:scaffold5206_cov78-Skeletonema_dohrnii-CCMP3373.AAC.2